MTRRWNGKALVDELATRLWDTSSANQQRIVEWINEIQNDLISELPVDTFKIKLKKLLPTEQEIIELSPQIPAAVTGVLASGGSLTDGTTYKVYQTFVIYDDDGKDYIESEPSPASAVFSPTGANLTITATLDTYDGDTSVKPTTIYRRIYVTKKADGDSAYGEPFYLGEVQDNTTTTYAVASEPTSTITPPSDSEVDQLTSDHLYFSSGNRFLVKQSQNKLRRFDPDGSTSATPSAFDYVGTHKIQLYPALSSSATTAQRTLSYFVYRRPHEIFYDVDRPLDLPITAKMALMAGVLWKGYEFRDRDGDQTKLNNYLQLKAAFIRKIKRQKGRPTAVRDVNGDTHGYEV